MRLHDVGMKYNTDKAFFHKYLDFYQEHLPGREFGGRLLEIGVMDGASVQMWREFYPLAEIVGVDINDKSHLKYQNITLLKLDATKSDQLESLGKFDIIIDDGSHMTKDQQDSFQHCYYSMLNGDGFYVLEDLHTSLWSNYVNSELNTLEFLETLDLDITHYRRSELEEDSMTCVIRRPASL